jgi:parallel beta-helix repeat protein
MCEVHEGGSIKAILNKPACKTITVHSGDYREEGWYKLQRNDVTLQAEGEVIISAIIVYGDNNVVRGFTITDRNQKTGIRTYGDNNLIENNEIYDTAEDGMWLWGRGNVIRGNYIHDIYDDRNWPDYDQHVDCFMTFSWDWPVENLLIEGNTCVLDRTQGSNQFFILTHNGNMTMKDIIFRNNVFIAKDSGYVPIAFFGDNSVTGMKIENNTFYNTTGQGDDAVWAENMPDVYIANNAIIGYDSVVRVVGSNVTQENNYINPPYGMLDIQGFDFHLVLGSPLIDAGVASGIEHDFDGNPRDERPDIGAFEYQMP